MTDITLVLLANGCMEVVQIFILTIYHRCIDINLIHHTLEVLHTIVTGLHAVVAEVLGLATWVHTTTFTTAIPQTRIILQYLCHLFTQLFLLLEWIRELRTILVSPLDSPLIVVVDTWEESFLIDAVLWLCHVVEAGVVHDRSGMTVFLYPSLVAQFLYWCSEAGTHVVAQS